MGERAPFVVSVEAAKLLAEMVRRHRVEGEARKDAA